MLTVFLVALIAIPSRLIVKPLGSAGTPAEMLGMCMLAGWTVHLLHGRAWRVRRRQSVRLFLYLFAVAVLLSYIVANLRPMLPDEARSADAGLLLVCAWLGILLTGMDHIRTRDRLDVLLRRVSIAAAALATLGIVQFVTKQPFVNLIQIPGLSVNNRVDTLLNRDGLARPAGTAIHPIEYGAVLTMSLPFALHYALADGWRPAVRRWYPVAALSGAIMISVSRSAIVSAIVVVCFVLPTWERRLRHRAFLAIVSLLGAAYAAVPGLLGTVTRLFTGISGDSSAQSRTGSYSLALRFFDRGPFFGRGFQTFLPSYRIFDNQYLGLAVETGLFGVLAFLGLLIAGVVTGMGIWRTRSVAAHPGADADARLGIAIAASVASAFASFALFDAFSFPMATGLLFLILGCAGALRRLHAGHRSARATSAVAV